MPRCRLRNSGARRPRISPQGVGLTLLWLVVFQPTAWGQQAPQQPPAQQPQQFGPETLAPQNLIRQKALGVGLFYARGVLNVGSPPSNASNEVKGYTDALPSRMQGDGPAVILNFGTWGLVFGQDDNTVAVNRTADVNQNGSSADDPLVLTARRVNTSLAVIWQPYPIVFLGVGRDSGTVEFEQRNPDNSTSTRKFGHEYDFYTLGFNIGFDPATNAIAPFLTAFTKTPLSRENFGGTINALGIGVFF